MRRLLDLGFLLVLGLTATACIQAEVVQPRGASSAAPAAVGNALSPADFDADMPKGFDLTEAKDMIELCVDLNEPSGGAGPAGWQRVFDGSQEAGGKGVGPYNNAWRLWKKQGADNVYAIAIRGTIEEWNSIKQDLLATSLSATRAEIVLGQERILPLRLAATAGAESHLGFSYGLAVLAFHKNLGILKQLKERVPAGSRVYITGHSQGAAVATLMHSFLHYAMQDPRYGLPGFGLKSYVFAQPKPGNWQYGMDFARVAGNRGLAYVINNTLDWVPQAPITVQFIDEPLSSVAAEYMHDLPVAKREVLELSIAGLKKVRNQVAETIKARTEGKMQAYASNLDEQFFTTKTAAVAAPKADSLNYVGVGNLVAVSGVDDPSIQHDGVFTQHHATNYRKLLQTLGK